MLRMTAKLVALMNAIDRGQVHYYNKLRETYWLTDDGQAIDVTDKVDKLQQAAWAGRRAHDHPASVEPGARAIGLTERGRLMLQTWQAKTRP